MAKVNVIVSQVELESDEGYPVDGVRVRCSMCRHSVEVFGITGRSIARGCMMLRDECPEGLNNFYERIPRNQRSPQP